MGRWEAWVGNSRIAHSSTYSILALDESLAQQKNMELVSQLLSQGWEVLTTDEHGHVVSMRRPITSGSVRAS